jgi:hypothetical protein
LGSARLTGAAGNCEYCKSLVGERCVILPKRDRLVFICGPCAGRVKAGIQALSRCYCVTHLFPDALWAWRAGSSHHDAQHNLSRRVTSQGGSVKRMEEPGRSPSASLCLLMILSKTTHHNERIAKPFISA